MSVHPEIIGHAMRQVPAERPAVWCELCGCDLPAEFANDAFPMCGECIESVLEAQTHEGTP